MRNKYENGQRVVVYLGKEKTLPPPPDGQQRRFMIDKTIDGGITQDSKWKSQQKEEGEEPDAESDAESKAESKAESEAEAESKAESKSDCWLSDKDFHGFTQLYYSLIQKTCADFSPSLESSCKPDAWPRLAYFNGT